MLAYVLAVDVAVWQTSRRDASLVAVVPTHHSKWDLGATTI